MGDLFSLLFSEREIKFNIKPTTATKPVQEKKKEFPETGPHEKHAKQDFEAILVLVVFFGRSIR